MITWLPIPFLLVTVSALIVVDERTGPEGPRNVRWVGVWKPLSTLLVILVAALAFTHPGEYDPLYGALVLLGLVFSLAGDVLLIFSAPRAFMAGLVAFLCAHLAYIAAFVHLRIAGALGLAPQGNLTAEVLGAVVIALVTGGIYFYLKPRLGRMKWPVILYMTAISIMVHRATAVAFAYPSRPVLDALVVGGALLFYLSDLILAIDRFRLGGKMLHGHLWNLSTYYIGQLLIALSVSWLI
jgi:uncharacterized membrane protein YhhN